MLLATLELDKILDTSSSFDPILSNEVEFREDGTTKLEATVEQVLFGGAEGMAGVIQGVEAYDP